jgi:hypothetical protein
MDNITELHSEQTKKRDDMFAGIRNLNKVETRIGLKKSAYIEKVAEAACDFLKKTLNVTDLKIIKSKNINNKWVLEAEVFEESAFIKSIGLPTKVKDRNIYSVCLNDNFEVESYERFDEFRPGN